MYYIYAPVNSIPGSQGPGWVGDSALTFYPILHSPNPQGTFFVTYFKGTKIKTTLGEGKNKGRTELFFKRLSNFVEVQLPNGSQYYLGCS